MVSRRCTPWFGLVLAGALTAGCHRDSDDDLGLRREAPRKVALDRLTEPSGLIAALAQPGASLDDKLGAHGFDLQRSLELDEGDAHDRVEQALHFDADGRGGFHLVHELGRPQKLALGPARGEGPTATRDKIDISAQGMEAVALGDKLYLRPRYGRFVERRPEPEELAHLRELGEQVVADDLEVLQGALAIAPAGEGNQLGRATRKLKLTRAAAPRAVEVGDDPRRAWRASVQVSELDGELELDAQTGVPLAGKLEARYELSREGHPLKAHLSLTLTPRAAEPLHAPEGAIASPRRPRPTIERNQLLEGLAPPVGTAAARAP